MKKIIRFKHTIFTLFLILATGLAAQAQLATGTWRYYPVYSDMSGIVETSGRLYIASGGCLYSVDKTTGETRFYDNSTILSDSNVKNIYTDPSVDYVVVVYESSNIDLIYDNDRVVNLPDIKDAGINTSRGINDVAIGNGCLYVATEFGIVVYDADKLVVKESGVYYTSVSSVGISDSGLIVATPGGNPNNVYFIAFDQSIKKFDSLTKVTTVYGDIYHFYPLDGGTRFAVKSGSTLRIATVSNGSTVRFTSPGYTGMANIAPVKAGGAYFVSSDTKLCQIGTDGSVSVVNSLPSDMASNYISALGGASSIWAADADGFANYRVTDSAVTLLASRAMPSDAVTLREVCNIYPTADGNGFYMINLGRSQNHPVGKGERPYEVMRCVRIDPSESEKTVIDPVDVSTVCSTSLKAQSTYGTRIIAPTFVAENPLDPSMIFIGSSSEGVYVIRDNKEIAKFDTNAPFEVSYIYRCIMDGKFDSYGNLWVANFGASTFFVLPKEKINGDIASVTESDWVKIAKDGGADGLDVKMLHCANSNLVFMVDSHTDEAFMVIDHNGTPAVASDDRIRLFSSVYDQDGKVYPESAWFAMAQDKNGQIWVATTIGVVMIQDPSKVFDSDFNVVRVKVPRNDGTNLADYLLDGETVYAVAVDNSNRKWFGTADSGVYLVSESGDEIIANFTTKNSPLPTNTITSLWCDPNSSSVFIGTLEGMYEYASDSAPASDDYSEVLAYPNPVTPDYSGWISITGLMDSSLVKIVDSSMNLVYQTTSEGGLAVWDGCNLNGQRVRSGVYYVLASQGTDSSSSSAAAVATKILVIN